MPCSLCSPWPSSPPRGWSSGGSRSCDRREHRRLGRRRAPGRLPRRRPDLPREVLMSDTAAGLLQLGLLIVLLALCYRPLGAYMAWAFRDTKHNRAERGIYKVLGVNADSQQSWPVYARAVLAFSAIAVVLVYGLQRLQHYLPFSNKLPNVEQALAWNTAVSFVTNTNWQNYVPEVVLGHLVQFAALAVQNFASAAVGIAVAIALVRGFTRNQTGQIGNFWVDLIRTSFRILLPIAIIGHVVIVAMDL